MRSSFLRTTYALAAALGVLGSAAVPCARAASAADDPRVLEAAAAYRSDRAAEAATLLGAVAEEQGVSPDLYYDLGLAQLAAGEVAPAILSFERARWLAPRDAGVAAGLEAARGKAGLPSPPLPSWQRARGVLGPDGWAVFGGLALVVACAGGTLGLLAPGAPARSPALRGSLRAVTGLSAAGVLLAALACGSLALEASRAIAVTERVALRLSPFETAPERASLQGGEAVRIEERHGAFVRVRTEDGRSGWAPAREIGAVVPG